MSVDDRGAHQPAEEGREGRAAVRRPHVGRHRRGRAVAVAAAEPELEEVEPLFTFLEADKPFVDLSDPAPEPAPAPLREFPPPLTRAVDAVQPPPPPEAALGPDDAGVRPGMFTSFRRWWRQESLARAAQKRAFATAEAIMRAQAVEQAAQPLDKAPSPESHTQAVRNVMALTEERFQSLGLRSDRLQDELLGISRTMKELHDLMLLGGAPEGVPGAAASALGTLEERFDALLGALSDEFRRRAEDTDRRLAEQLTLQSAELAMLLESAVERIRSAIPEGFQAVRAAIPKELAQVRAEIPREIQRIRAVIPEEMERVREQQRKELDQIMELSQKQIELIRATSRKELDKIREAIPEGFDELRSMLPEEFTRVRDAIPVEMEKVRSMLPEEIERVREANARDFERILAQIPDELEKVRLTIPAEMERVRATIPEAIGRVERVLPGQVERLTAQNAELLASLREQTSEALERLRSANAQELENVGSSLRETATGELERLREEIGEQLDRVRWAIPAKIHEVISEGSGFTSADSVEGERAEPR
jgi:hypothetical protein